MFTVMREFMYKFHRLQFTFDMLSRTSLLQALLIIQWLEWLVGGDKNVSRPPEISVMDLRLSARI